jgi:FtsP/CotA-like multicopper oxidase with cupredoxin domain
MVLDPMSTTDLLGDVALVNGVAWPRMAVERRRYRFRVLVASNSRPYLLALSDGRPFTVVASDGGLLPAPVRVKSLLAVMAERYDVVVDFSDLPAGRSVSLVNQLEAGRLHELVRFDVGRLRGTDGSRGPAVLGDPPRLAPVGAPVDRVWRFAHAPAGFVINGRTYDPDRVDARPRLGDTEVWELRSEGLGFFHPVHPHLVRFQVLSRDGGPPAAYERGWKDTVFVGERSVVRIAARFGPHRGRYVLHCHNLVHEDHSMMTQFEVV